MNTPKVRVDLWLWSARFAKSRTLAQELCKGGHVRVNDERAKPSTQIGAGDRIEVRRPGLVRIAVVKQTLNKRVSAPLAQAAYEDHSPEPLPYIPIARRERGAGRPTKKERRDIERLRRF